MSKTNETQKQNILILEMVNNENLNIINQYLSHNEYTYTYIFIDNILINNDFLNIPLSCQKVFMTQVSVDKDEIDDFKSKIKAPFGCSIVNLYGLDGVNSFGNSTKYYYHINDIINDFSLSNYNVNSFLKHDDGVSLNYFTFYYDITICNKTYKKLVKKNDKICYVYLVDDYIY
jgi:hypothetical protein